MTSRLFEGKEHSETYRLHRPTYPDELYEKIKRFYFHDETTNQKVSLAVDIACGNGQATVALSNICENVIGLDVSPSQIENAVKKENIEYRCQAAEDLTFLESNSVDLVTIAAALHWLDRDAFFAEVHRVLKDKTGVLAVWTYDLGFLNNPQANEIYQQFFNEFLRDFWDRKGVVAIDCYESIADTFPYQSSLEVNIFKNERTTTIENLLGFIESISAVQTYRKKQGDIEYQRVINELRENLFAFYKDWNDSEGNRKPIILTIPVKQYLMRKNHGQ